MDEDDDEEDDGQAKAKAKDGQPAKPVAGLNTPGMPCKVFTESTFSVSFLRSTSVIRKIKKNSLDQWISASGVESDTPDHYKKFLDIIFP